MSEQLAADIRDQARGIARAWLPALTALRDRHQATSPDWERTFPGMLALIGIQGLCWPIWAASLAVPRRYSLPEPDAGQQVWRFWFRALSSTAALAQFGGPSLSDWDGLHARLSHPDVIWTLGTLNERGKVIALGQATDRLTGVIGRRLIGEDRIDLPHLECEDAIAMLDDWRATMAEVAPRLAEAAARVRASCEAADDVTDCERAARDSFAVIMAQVWDGLLKAGCFSAGVTARPKGLRALFARAEQRPFAGVLLLHGDHMELWGRLKQGVI